MPNLHSHPQEGFIAVMYVEHVSLVDKERLSVLETSPVAGIVVRLESSVAIPMVKEKSRSGKF